MRAGVAAICVPAAREGVERGGDGPHVGLEALPQPGQRLVAAALQRGVQGLVLHGQVQLDDRAHGDDALGDGRRVLRHARMGEVAQGCDAAQDVGVLVLEFVDVHGVFLRAQKVWVNPARPSRRVLAG